jgi:hypothetical protein
VNDKLFVPSFKKAAKVDGLDMLVRTITFHIGPGRLNAL